MIAQFHAQAYRAGRGRPPSRQRIAASISAFGSMRELWRVLVSMVAVTLCVAAAAGYFLQWRTGTVLAMSRAIEQTGAALKSEHTRLLAERTRLRSASRVYVVAAERLGLYVPAKNQVHRMH